MEKQLGCGGRPTCTVMGGCVQGHSSPNSVVSAEFGCQPRVPKHERGQRDGCATYQVELKAKNLANWLCAVEIKGAPRLGEVVSLPVLRCSSGAGGCLKWIFWFCLFVSLV